MPLSPWVRRSFGDIPLPVLKRALRVPRIEVVLFEDMLYVMTHDGELFLVEPCLVQGRLGLRYSVRNYVPDVRDFPSTAVEKGSLHVHVPETRRGRVA